HARKTPNAPSAISFTRRFLSLITSRMVIHPPRADTTDQRPGPLATGKSGYFMNRTLHRQARESGEQRSSNGNTRLRIARSGSRPRPAPRRPGKRLPTARARRNWSRLRRVGFDRQPWVGGSLSVFLGERPVP